MKTEVQKFIEEAGRKCMKDRHHRGRTFYAPAFSQPEAGEFLVIAVTVYRITSDEKLGP